jgi:hypothetical protein
MSFNPYVGNSEKWGSATISLLENCWTILGAACRGYACLHNLAKCREIRGCVDVDGKHSRYRVLPCRESVTHSFCYGLVEWHGSSPGFPHFAGQPSPGLAVNSAARTLARMLALMLAGNFGHDWTTTRRSASAGSCRSPTAPDSAPPSSRTAFVPAFSAGVRFPCTSAILIRVNLCRRGHDPRRPIRPTFRFGNTNSPVAFIF